MEVANIGFRKHMMGPYIYVAQRQDVKLYTNDLLPQRKNSWCKQFMKSHILISSLHIWYICVCVSNLYQDPKVYPFLKSHWATKLELANQGTGGDFSSALACWGCTLATAWICGKLGNVRCVCAPCSQTKWAQHCIHFDFVLYHLCLYMFLQIKLR